MTEARLAVLAAGGTGGHLFPAQALAETLLDRGWRVALATDARGLRYAGGFPAAVERIELRAATTARGGLTARLAVPVTLARGCLGAWMRFRRARPAAVAGFGGYPAIPALAAAWALGIPRLIHEQNGVLGRVNRAFAGRVDRVACGIWPVSGAPSGARLEHVGNPVRGAVLEAAAAPYEAPGEGALRLLVFGGSQGASVFAERVPAALAGLPEALRSRLSVVQQIREGEADAVSAAYAAAGIRAELAPFFADMPARIAAAHLVVARAGASTVAELAAIGRPSILVPLPSAMADHQSANARSLAGPGAAVLAPQAALTPASLGAEIARILGTPAAAAAMAAAARAEGRPGAAHRLADMLEEIAA
ncbi:UDP-N-acetylglucosamine--N-acetylmuramyl-(pentapeptide) pyrophosphoryl-undecaprenol N-acetylglucosamine transferase [Paralimibaculum aggregatum]|uniref:UDP-N-acetylglucosamine--N-acetylmuramyl-(pentapeptide) pyrophosphoryl-undecaprenol N-acetylglucosamine transferase n=1 Tax=Paralimibaculum aggregatum TaxID=3036245 RepID=A0ABQ6LJI3_9RHOB|nr:UDP-N-acetylglucosamine--N-acetylmuramyl-(pentapeptide) pyrophosphoryl-undecaprenol N-acetylglucosamine transferase [Limibaculum sp. NKW23]GMG82344.1 UDP-N-acetylglucosamine--N-acetylmuramyl-(pentapeptide) pyrophosphoryl-undecaprenol N-acetylglucosamine transferase [Limibaculum sp. NKW23]